MALCRAFAGFHRNIPKISTVLCMKQVFLCPEKVQVIPDRGMKAYMASFLKAMKVRRKIAGPDRLRKRNESQEWNYQAEIYCFAKRLNEELSEETLRTAFTHKSFIDAEEQKRKELGISSQDVQINLVPNTSLISVGEEIMNKYIKGFIRHCYEALPEEGVTAVFEYLMSDNVLAHVSSNIGTSDLILTAEVLPENSTLAATLKAIIGAIATERSHSHAELFVQDFVCTQLIGKDLLEIWEIPNPGLVLESLLAKQGRAAYEARLVFESGRNTLESIYQVALYSDKVFLGQGPGETLAIAEEMAAYDALRRLFQLNLNQKPLPFGKSREELKSNAHIEHARLAEWCDKNFGEYKNLVS